MSNLVSHAERELRFAGLLPAETELVAEDTYDEMVADAVLAHVKLFAEQGHSGFSASMVTSILEKLLRFEPLSPLTGVDAEWVELDYAPDMVGQNKRCSHVFKRSDGTAYDSEGRIFVDPDGMQYTNGDSRVDIAFPYTPSSVLVHRDWDGNVIDGPTDSGE